MAEKNVIDPSQLQIFEDRQLLSRYATRVSQDEYDEVMALVPSQEKRILLHFLKLPDSTTDPLLAYLEIENQAYLEQTLEKLGRLIPGADDSHSEQVKELPEGASPEEHWLHGIHEEFNSI